jgi:hypothetical protein
VHLSVGISLRERARAAVAGLIFSTRSPRPNFSFFSIGVALGGDGARMRPRGASL